MHAAAERRMARPIREGDVTLRTGDMNCDGQNSVKILQNIHAQVHSLF
jgi:hypothetical protein